MKKNLKNILIKLLIWLKNSNPLTRGIVMITGQVRDELYDPKTGKTEKGDYAIQLLGFSFGVLAFGAFNAIDNNLKNSIAKWIGASNASEWIGANGLSTQATYEGKDGIIEITSASEYTYTTTKDSGGTGAEDNIVFKGVTTAAGAETHGTLGLGLVMTAGPNFDLTTEYATQVVNKSLTSAQVYTVFWTLTVS